MSKKQLSALFICNLIPMVLGNGLLPLLPVYATQLGASPALAGYYLAFSYLALALGTLAGGWLSDRFQQRKRWLIIAGLINIPLAWLLGQVSNAWQLTALTALVWFLGGLGLALTLILAGLFAGPEERGKVFGTLALTGGLGAVIGGLSFGAMADRWGFPALFAALAGVAAILPLAGLWLDDKPLAVRRRAASVSAPSPFGRGFFLLLVAGVAAGIGVFVGRLATSLAMNRLEFLAAGITSTTAVGGLVALPLSPWLGRLSDRIGRKRLLGLCYLASGLGLATLALSSLLWHFWLASALIAPAAYVATGLGSAFATDLVSKESLGKGLAAFNTTAWLGGILGFAFGGYAIQAFGQTLALIAAIVFSLGAILLLLPIRQAR